MAVSWSSIVASINTTTIPDTPEPPYTYLQGTGPVGTNGDDPATLLDANYKKAFPNYDWSPGQTLTPPSGKEPAGFSQNASYEQFSTWTSEWQAYMLDLWRNQTGSNASIELKDGNGVSHYVIRSLESPKVYDMDLLQKRDFAAMSKADQDNIAADPYFLSTLSGTVGLIPSSSASDAALRTQAGVKAAIQVLIDAAKSKVNGQTALSNNLTVNLNDLPDDASVFPGKLRTAMQEGQATVIAELANIQARFDSTGVYDQTAIQAKIDEVMTRFTRLYTFADSIRREGGAANDDSTFDSGARLKQGFDIFLAQEKRMLELDNQSLKVANSGTVGSKRLDAPTLVYLFQQYTMLQTEANNNALAEEANQFNDVLKVYQAMQAKINDIVKTFDPKESNQKRNFLAIFGLTPNFLSGENLGGASWSDFLDDQSVNNSATQGGANDDLRQFFDYFAQKAGDEIGKKLLYMFNTTGGGMEGPLEKIYNIERPTTDMFIRDPNQSKNRDLMVTNFRDGWNAFATQLGDKVTQLNQQSQILSNKINSSEKEKNRYFEQANGALSKLYDVMNNVARSI